MTDKQIQEEREEKKRYLLRKLSFRPSVDELKNRKVIRIILTWPSFSLLLIIIIWQSSDHLLLVNIIIIMDEGTIKTPIPKCRFYWCFCLGWCSNFVGPESGLKQSVKLPQIMVYNTSRHPPPSPTPTLSVYTVRLLWEGGGWGRSEKR